MSSQIHRMKVLAGLQQVNESRYQPYQPSATDIIQMVVGELKDVVIEAKRRGYDFTPKHIKYIQTVLRNNVVSEKDGKFDHDEIYSELDEMARKLSGADGYLYDQPKMDFFAGIQELVMELMNNALIYFN